jgi:glycosyltransferase involved in cell wall biosynthesis
MRVLHINSTDYYHNGGTAIAMYRLNIGLRQANIDSKILCRRKTLPRFKHSIISKRPKGSKEVEKLLLKPMVSKLLGLNDVHSVSCFTVPYSRPYKEADVLNLHCIHGSFNYLILPFITKRKAAVFTFHDMWAFTGHCTYSYDCERWKTGCGNCPYPKSHPAIEKDGTALEWKLKNWIYQNSNFAIVCPSQWMAEQTKQSMLKNFPIHHIPNGIDTEIFKPYDRDWCRSELGISPDKKVLMFAAANLREKRKGGDFLIQVLQTLPESIKSQILLLLIGDDSRGQISQDTGIEAIGLGYVREERLMAMAYSSADLFLFPSLADNLPLVLQESLACGLPIVSFKVGGIPDLVRPGITGYLAEPQNVEDFRQGVVKLLENDVLRSQMKQQSREIAVKEYALEVCSQRYIDLYQHLLLDKAAKAA